MHPYFFQVAHPFSKLDSWYMNSGWYADVAQALNYNSANILYFDYLETDFVL